jgi:uncharacterized membrane protein YeaQ/YmgE (transglycosylase-associated protein family)
MLWHMSQEQWMITLVFIGSIAFIYGFIADRVLGVTGFGLMGNSILLLLGTYTGLYAYNIYGYQLEWYPMMSLVVAIGSGCTLLLFMAILKRTAE